MKLLHALPLVLATAVHAHSIFQRIRVNGQDQGYLTALRAPAVNNVHNEQTILLFLTLPQPVQNVQDNAIICNTGDSSSSAIVTVPAGATVGTFWQHILGGPQGSNDADNPIASSHKGPLQVYLAKVANASTSASNGLQWFKVASEGLNNGVWGVDTMINNAGWWSFTMPSCVAAGQYLMRVELIALHSAYNQGAAQFYVSCGQINVTGSGTLAPKTFLSFPGSYSATDPGIMINIYGSSGKPDNGGKAYVAPGGAVATC